MILQQEYYHRYNIKAPLVFHKNKIDLILKSKTNRNKFFFSIVWTCPDRPRPGFYLFRQYIFNQNCENSRHYEILGEPEEISWEFYEERFINWIENAKLSCIVPNSLDENILWWWEAFLFSYDNNFSELDLGLISLVSKSIDYNLSQINRYKYYQDSLYLLKKKNSFLYLIYLDYFLPLSENYSEWISTLFK